MVLQAPSPPWYWERKRGIMDQYLIWEGTHPFYGGEIRKYKFENGYGATVLRNRASNGGPELWELSVTKDGKITYDTPITDDVIGWLEWDEVDLYLEQIKNL